MNIIFLDVDGVLNSMPYFDWLRDTGRYKEGGFNEISDYHLRKLAKIYRTCDAKIVLSSTWRESDKPEDPEAYLMYRYLLDSLSRYGMEIIDKTPVIAMIRPLEIYAWLKSHPDENLNFVILDDDFPEEDYAKCGLASHLVQTKYFCNTKEEGGLQDEHVEKAIKILKER